MKTKKLSKPMQALLDQYMKYIDGSFVARWPFPVSRTNEGKKDEIKKDAKISLEKGIKDLISTDESKCFTFPDWYYVCMFLPIDPDYCTRLKETAEAPHEKMFVLLLAVYNMSVHNNRDYKQFGEILRPEKELVNQFFRPEGSPVRQWYDSIPKTTHGEFSLLWGLVDKLPHRERFLRDTGPWVWGFWREKCDDRSSDFPYLDSHTEKQAATA